MTTSNIKDNYSQGTVGDFLQHNITPNANLSIVSAYFTIHAYNKLKHTLNAINSLKFLFGEPTFIQSLNPNPANTHAATIQDNHLHISLKEHLDQKAIAKACAHWLKTKAEIRSMVKPNFLHGKLYHIQQENGFEEAIMGSSNFTVNGLGLGGSKNIELNLTIDSKSDRNDLKDWFDDLWNGKNGKVEDVKAEVLRYLEQLYKENEPEFIYYKTLYHIFEQYLDEQQKGGLLDESTGFYDSQIWNALYDFQKDGVKGAINKILKHNGCIIADSVGLGKTFEALAIIKYFQKLHNNILVICPKKLRENWTLYQASENNRLNPFKKDRFSYKLLYHTDLARTSGHSAAANQNLEHFDWNTFGLVVIDESHHFRGNPSAKLQDDGSLKLNRAQWLMDKIIKSGVKTKVLMLSATPVNNTLRDLRNQIAFITEGQDNALLKNANIQSIATTLQNAQRNFTLWADPKNKHRSLKQLLERLDSSFFKLLNELTIARSRKHITTFYNIEKIGKFPTRHKPKSVYSDIDLKNDFPTYDQINDQILNYKLSVYNPSAYVRADKQEKYKALAHNNQVLHFTQSDREYFLIGMMKVNYLKRLESSIKSFTISLERTIKKINERQDIIKDFQQQANPPLNHTEDLESYTPDPDELEEDDPEADDWQVGKKLKFNLADLNLDQWLADLETDKIALNKLLQKAQAVTPTRDAKLEALKKHIQHKINNPLNPHNKKVLIFTAFADTATYLYTNLQPWLTNTLHLHSALVSGSYTQTTLGQNNYNHILTNFSPHAKNRAKINAPTPIDQIDILIATDCISEGQNLQDCDTVINYDIHWNPVRIIQRFGRIDRLGSINHSVQLINFWPTKDLDNYINLKERVEARMALVDVTATGEDNILNNQQLEELITEDLKYRNRQLKRLQNEILDLEDMEETISLTDFSLDDFKIELLNFIEQNRDQLHNAPLGLYAIVPSPSGSYAHHLSHTTTSPAQQTIIKRGVIFCLAQKETIADNHKVNPLNPYFLIYIRDDGTVRYNYTHPKQILEIYRLLCKDRQAPYQALCDLFNQETDHGQRLSPYTTLLEKAVREIVQIFHKKNHLNLTTGRGALLIPPAQQINHLTDFKLITWLIIK